MSDMIERVARALAPEAWKHLGLADSLAQVNRRKASLKHARAAIEAMRLPDDERNVVWNDQIDAALKGDGQG